MATFVLTVDAGTGPIVGEVLDAAQSAGVYQTKITIPAAVTDATLTIRPEPGLSYCGVKPQINGTGADTWTAFQSRADTDETGESITLSNAVSTDVGSPGRLVCVIATGNTESFIYVREYHVVRVAT